jgi:hypothetical protein
MNRFVIALTLAVTSISATAADNRAAAAVVKKYSEAIACQVVDVREDKNQYKTIELIAGEKDLGGMGSVHVVYWLGDVGCSGGNGTIVPNFTIVEHNGSGSATPVVVTDYKFPQLELVQLTSLSSKGGALIIQGLTYGPNDQQNSPQKRVSYTLKIDQEKRTFVKK